MIIGKYHITDCENYGDINNAIDYVKSIDSAIIIMDHYWDGKDCGEAYVRFSFPENKFILIYSRLDNGEYSDNINNYLDFSGEKTSLFLDSSVFMGRDQFNRLVNGYRNKFTDDVITVELFFSSTSIPDKIILDKALDVLGNGTKILGVNLNMVDKNLFVHVLFETLSQNINEKKLHEFGDYCLGGYGWLHNNGIYGQMTFNTLFCANIKTNWDKIKNKNPLRYKRRYCEPILVNYNDYLIGLNIKENIVIGNIEFNLDKFQ